MKKIKITYWIFTGLLVAFLLLSSIPDIKVVPQAVDLISTNLHYPVYIIRFLGIAKLLAAIAILYPGLPRLKEWAYAGFFFDLTGAMYSLISVGTPLSKAVPVFLIGYILIFGSSIFYHKMQKTVLLK